jgi:hypothetical protein
LASTFPFDFLCKSGGKVAEIPQKLSGKPQQVGRIEHGFRLRTGILQAVNEILVDSFVLTCHGLRKRGLAICLQALAIQSINYCFGTPVSRHVAKPEVITSWIQALAAFAIYGAWTDSFTILAFVRHKQASGFDLPAPGA